jgi:hypothetical protein
MDYPRAGIHYPRSHAELQAWFPTDADCVDYLDWLRWPGGFICPSCAHPGGWRLADGRYECAGCNGRISVTAGTIFDRTRTPLTAWFSACWLFATQEDGISALSMQRSLDIGSYQTSWAMLHRLRSVLARPGRDLLAGTVEVGEAVVGGGRTGGADGEVLTGIAVEVDHPGGVGRCRMQVLADGSAGSLTMFAAGAVAVGSQITTRAAKPLPSVRLIAAAATRWLLRTHQGSVAEAHLPAYLDEFVFRFNQRQSSNCGMAFYQVLGLATAHNPVRLRDLLASPRPPTARARSAFMAQPERPQASRPWRAAHLR